MNASVKVLLMTADGSTVRNLQVSILLQSQTFLMRLRTGASDDVLTSLLFRIRVNELELMKQQRLMLHPRMWNILFTRYVNRRPIEIIDTLN